MPVNGETRNSDRRSLKWRILVECNSLLNRSVAYDIVQYRVVAEARYGFPLRRSPSFLCGCAEFPLRLEGACVRPEMI